MSMSSIKTFFSKMMVSALCLMLLGTLSFFVYNEINEAKRAAQQRADLFSKANKIKLNTAKSNSGANIASNATLPFQEGKHYQKLAAKITTQPLIQTFVSTDPGKIQVIEFFNYGCFWCERLHSSVNDWVAKKPGYVAFYRFPIVFNKGWEVLAKAYFMVEMLGQHHPLDVEFFKAVHQDNIDLSTEKKLQEFFAKYGVDDQKFAELYHSFTVTRAVAQSNELANAYQITASPAFILNTPSGSYLVTASMAGTEKAVLEVVEYLLAKESKELTQGTAPGSVTGLTQGSAK